MEMPGATIILRLAPRCSRRSTSHPPDIQASVAKPEGTAPNLVFRTGPGSIDDLAVVVNDIRDNVEPARGHLGDAVGLAVVGVGLLENLEANRVLLTYLAMLFVFLFLAVRLRSIVRSLLSLVPVRSPSARRRSSPGRRPQAEPDDRRRRPARHRRVHRVHVADPAALRRGAAAGLEPQEAVDVGRRRTGRAFIVSGADGDRGVAVMSFSSLPLLRDFGIIVAMNVAVALAAPLLLFPLVGLGRGGWGWYGYKRGAFSTKTRKRPRPEAAAAAET